MLYSLLGLCLYILFERSLEVARACFVELRVERERPDFDNGKRRILSSSNTVEDWTHFKLKGGASRVLRVLCS
jgi:hypothetical protein